MNEGKHQKGPEPRFFVWYGTCLFCGTGLMDNPDHKHALKHAKNRDKI